MRNRANEKWRTIGTRYPTERRLMLDAVAAKRGITRADAIAEAIDEYVERHAPDLLRVA